MIKKLLGLYLVLGLCFMPLSELSFAGQRIRVGYFPNITHAQAVVGMAQGDFQAALGRGTEIVPYIFNAGPSVIEAMMAGHLDLAYIGPNPAVNGYLRSKGKLLKIVAGAASGGAALVLRAGLHPKSVKDLTSYKLASPQLGNTQDVALKFYLLENGLKTVQHGGNVEVLAIPNPDQLNLMKRKAIDGAWTIEPWVSRLVSEAGGSVWVDERSLWPEGKFVTANIIVSQKFLKQQRNLVKAWVRAHVDLTRKINTEPLKYQRILNQELKRITGAALPEEIITQAFARFELTWDPLEETLYTAAERGYQLGFLGRDKPDLQGIYDLSILAELKLVE